ncbi:MAG: lysylphosphatidylglycerol synthase transmembrane domain-containing protein, partial [Gemmataceae bacterium]
AALDVRYWLAALAVYVLAQLASSLRWQLLARPLHFHLPYHRYLALYFVGMFFNLVLPTSVGGDVVRAWYLGAPTNRRKAAFVTVVAERGSGLGVLVVLACAAAPLVPTELPRWMVVILVGLAVALVACNAALPFVHLLTRLPLVGRRFVRVAEVTRTYIGLPGLLLAAAGLSLLVQLASVTQFWLVATGLGLDLPFGYLAVAVPLVTLLTLVPISISGMGLRELGLVVLLAPLGVTTAQAVTLSLLGFAVNVAASLAGAGVYLAGPYPRYSQGQGGPDDDASVGRDPDQGREGQPAPAS